MESFKQWSSKVLLLAAFIVPMESGKNWQVLKYRKIEPNQVSFSGQGLVLKVKNSASPIIYPLPKIMKLSSVRILGVIQGSLKLPEKIAQGEKGADDYQVRIGLVVKGEKSLNFVQKAVAADWVITLFNLAPKGVGVDHILFLNGTHIAEHVGAKREHPASDLIKEQVVWRLPENGKFDLKHDFKKAPEVLALWLSSDGDDSQSEYQIQFQKIELVTEDSGGVVQAGTDNAD